MSDIVGCHCMKGKQESDSNAYFCVYGYPFKKKTLSKKSVRKRVPLTFTVDECTSHDENLKVAQHWRVVFLHLLRGIVVTDVSILTEPIARRMLVLVNPFSGPGKALKIFQERVIPVFAEADIHFRMVITEYAGHARAMMKRLDLDEWYGIIIVSGDGLIFEVINGLMERDDWAVAIKKPIGTIPGGSGNALSCAINYAAGEPYLERAVLHASLIIAKHQLMPMDLVALDTVSGKRLYSFLSVAWGMISDIDIESEKYRYMGDARFFFEGMVKIAARKLYRGTLSFLPIGEYNGETRPHKPRDRTTSDVGTANFKEDDQRLRTVSCPTVGFYDSSRAHAPTRQDSDVERGPVDGLENISAPVNDVFEYPMENGEISESLDVDNNNEEIGKGDSAEVSGETLINGSHRENGTGMNKKMSSYDCIETPLLNPLDEDVPDDWITIDVATYSFAAAYQTHFNASAFAAPDSQFDDGVIQIMFVKKSATRKVLLQSIAEMAEGKHLENRHFTSIKCKAFRLVPITDGYLCADGEKVDYGPIQGQVLARYATLIGRSPIPENE
ncbi:unnamed protein product [Owenia fusiformis]|uniref:sphingosine kinase n=1 Tax=Owenia fusiformis TaxID=6347 RepID=A0A8S4PRW3_OWEFU|nr:unnamed protein product [Owenia fusiformis]